MGGLIPAHAGKTAPWPPSHPYSAAHPRSRGENLDKGASGLMASGSSPLTRGKRIQRPCPPHGGGLIPAHAGKTRTRSARAMSNRAHPRSRGENDVVEHFLKQRPGSSPLTRGKHRRRARGDR